MLMSVGGYFRTFFWGFPAPNIISIWTRSLSLVVGCKIVFWELTKYQHYLTPVCQGCCLYFPGEQKKKNIKKTKNKWWHMPNDTCCGCGKLHDKKMLMNRNKKKKTWQSHSSNNRYYFSALEKKLIFKTVKPFFFLFFVPHTECCFVTSVMTSLIRWYQLDESIILAWRCPTVPLPQPDTVMVSDCRNCSAPRSYAAANQEPPSRRCHVGLMDHLGTSRRHRDLKRVLLIQW